MISSYPSIFSLGHKAVKDIFTSPVVVQEKVDGAQISFGYLGTEVQGLAIQSRKADIHPEAPLKDWTEAVKTIKTLPLYPGWIYRGEFLRKPKHNALAYSRVPEKHIILFDVEKGLQDFLEPWELAEEAKRLELESVPLLFAGEWTGGIEQFKELLQLESVLGGQKIEGVVIKNYNLYGPDKHVLMAKFVSEAFKEAHGKMWGSTPKGKGDIIQRFIETLKTEARWNKAVQHLREQGLILDEPKDIGLIIQEVKRDVEADAGEWMKEQMFKEFVPQVLRGVAGGVAEWWKEKLLKRQFEGDDATVQGHTILEGSR